MIKSLKTTLLTALLAFTFAFNIHSQDVIQNREFKYIPVINGEAVLIKEIRVNDITEGAQTYREVREWVKNNYSKDIINSSILYNQDKMSARIKSKVDLLRPILNEQNESEKATMTYELNVFVRKGVCVMQISDIKYRIVNAIPVLKERINAVNFVT